MSTSNGIAPNAPFPRRPFPRRAFLRGAGVAIALPWLESLLPRIARAGGPAPKGLPQRIAFFYAPNGVNQAAWKVGDEGALRALSPTLAPLAPWMSKLSVLSGLAHHKADANGDGPGDHARAGATFLTAAQAKKGGNEIHVGVSIDQVIAQAVGAETMFPSLELSCDPGAVAGECDSGYSCAYSSHISWRTPSMPMAKETDPRSLFDRLFTDAGGPGTREEKALRAERRQSILDLALDDARALSGSLGASDRRKVDEYLSGVREIERRLERSVADAGAGTAGGAAGRPAGIPRDFAEHYGLLADLLALAFKSDLTRVATFMLANEGSNRSYASIGVPEGHHGISHHGGNAEMLAKVAKIDRFHVELFSRFVKSLDAMPEGDATVLDRSLLVYGSCIGDGNRHNHDDLPILLAGASVPFAVRGQHVQFKRGTPVGNLFASLGAQMTGTPTPVGDATGVLGA
jgi:hypothetical protein